jgi:predicted dehydrogenase
MGGVAIPQRTVLIERLAGQTIDVEANDHMLVHLDFGDNTFGQLLASFALPKSHAPALELHGSLGSVSISLDEWYNGNGPSDVFVRDESPLGVEGWMRDVVPPAVAPYENVIGAGPAHFVACLRGEEEPVLTAAHACHVSKSCSKPSNRRARGGRSTSSRRSSQHWLAFEFTDREGEQR